MKWRVVVEYDPETGSYASYCPELPGCASAGDTQDEALEGIEEAIALYLDPSPEDVTTTGRVFEVEVPSR